MEEDSGKKAMMAMAMATNGLKKMRTKKNKFVSAKRDAARRERSVCTALSGCDAIL